MIRTILVCEAQVPFVHGGAEFHVRELVAQLRARGYDDRARQRAVQVVSEGGDPRARRGLAAARSQREQRPADRSASSRTKFPTYFVRHPEQGRVADPPVPRRLRAVRHARTATSTTSKRDVALRDRLIALDTRDARRVPAAVHATRRTPPARLAQFNGLTAEPLYHPPRLAGAAARRARTATTCCRSAGSSRSSASTSRFGRMAHVDRAAVDCVVAGDGTQRANARGAGRGARRRRPRARSSARSTTTSCIELYAGALGGGLSRRSTRTSAT